MQKAATHGPFAIVTLGAELKQEIIRNAELYGYSDLLAEVRILPWTVAEVSSNLDKYREDFRSACQSLVDEKHVSAIIIGGGPSLALRVPLALSCPSQFTMAYKVQFRSQSLLCTKIKIRSMFFEYTNQVLGILRLLLLSVSSLKPISKRDEGKFGCRSIGAMF